MQVGEKWNGWDVVRVIGHGSFGAVYEIHRDVFGTVEKAALKQITIPQDDSETEELLNEGYDLESISQRYSGYLQDIVKEYTLMLTLKGETNIVSCDDLDYRTRRDSPGWDIFIRMELLTPMTAALDAADPEGQAVRVGKDMCGALVLCMDQHIIHRDIKPQNIFLSPRGQYKLGDFGVAKVASRTTVGTRTGTFRYMAPEVYSGQPYGATADIYSLGMVLYWLLNRRRGPFVPLPPEVPGYRQDEEAQARRFHGEPLPPPADGSDRLKRIVLKACAFDPRDRYRDAREMLADLRDLDRADRAGGATVPRRDRGADGPSYGGYAPNSDRRAPGPQEPGRGAGSVSGAGARSGTGPAYGTGPAAQPYAAQPPKQPPQQPQQQQQQQPQQKEKKRRGAPIAVVLIALVAFAIGGVLARPLLSGSGDRAGAGGTPSAMPAGMETETGTGTEAGNEMADSAGTETGARTSASAGKTYPMPGQEGYVYTEPQELGSDILSMTVQYCGDLYQLPAPLSAFTANGWVVTEESYYYSDENDAGWVCRSIQAERDGLRTGFDLCDFGSGDPDRETWYVTSLQPPYDDTDYDSVPDAVVVPLGIGPGMRLSAVLALLDGYGYEELDNSSGGRTIRVESPSESVGGMELRRTVYIYTDGAKGDPAGDCTVTDLYPLVRFILPDRPLVDILLPGDGGYAYAPPSELGNDLLSLAVQVGGDLYRLPAPVSAFADNGWKVTNESSYYRSDSGNGLGWKVLRAEMEWYDGISMSCTISDLGTGASSHGDWYVIEVSDSYSDYREAEARNGLVVLPGGICCGMSMREAAETLGLYDSGFDEGVGHTFFYSAGIREEGDIAVNANVNIYEFGYEFETAYGPIVEQVSAGINIYDPQAAMYGMDTVDIITPDQEGYVYAQPQTLGGDPLSMVVEYGGDLYQLPAPVSAFEANGWEVTESSETGEAYFVQWTRGGVTDYVYASDLGLGLSSVDDMYINSLSWGKGGGTAMVLSPGIRFGMTEQEVLDALEGVPYDWSDNLEDMSRSYTFSGQTDSGMYAFISVSVDYAADEVTYMYVSIY